MPKAISLTTYITSMHKLQLQQLRFTVIITSDWTLLECLLFWKVLVHIPFYTTVTNFSCHFQLRTAVSLAPAAGVRPSQRVPRYLRGLVQVPGMLRVPLLRRAAGVPRALAAAAPPAVRRACTTGHL